jgi:hypothetical protein
VAGSHGISWAPDSGESEVPEYQYVAWFRDHSASPEDQDYEWCACFWVVAADSDKAQAWGDQLAADYSRRKGGFDEFLRSHLDSDPWSPGAEPRVVAGEPASDEVIGW